MHVLLVFVLTHKWSSTDRPLEIVRPPQVVQASLVELEAKAPPKKQESNVIDLTTQKQRAEEQARKKAERKRLEAEKKVAEKKAAEEAERKRLAEEKKKKEQEKQRLREERERLAREEAEQHRLNEFNKALAEEEGFEAANEVSQEVVAGIKATIAQQTGDQFNAPPSARRGMVATVRVNMVPTGRVVQVDVIESSGNEAFDRAVIQAVRKAQPYSVVQTLEPRVFERNFRQFSFRFNPQNLRL